MVDTPTRGPERARQVQPMLNRAIEATPVAVRALLLEVARRFTPILAPEVMADLELALAEVLNNVVEHAYEGAGRGLIHVSIVRSDTGLSCAVADDGRLLPAECLASRQSPGADRVGDPVMGLPEGGFGWFLIQGLCQDVCYYRENGRNFLVFLLPVEAAQVEKDLGGTHAEQARG